MRNPASVVLFLISLVYVQPWTPSLQQILYSIRLLMCHLSLLVLKLPTSNTPSFPQSWATLLLKATSLRIPTLPHHRPPLTHFLPAHQSTPRLGPRATTPAPCCRRSLPTSLLLQYAVSKPCSKTTDQLFLLPITHSPPLEPPPPPTFSTRLSLRSGPSAVLLLHLPIPRRIPSPSLHRNQFLLCHLHNPRCIPLHPAGHFLPLIRRTSLSPPCMLCCSTQPRTAASGLELLGPKTAEEVYGSITRPYDYTEGYHFLMKVLPFRSVY